MHTAHRFSKTCAWSLVFFWLCLEGWAAPQTQQQAAQAIAGWLAATPAPLGASLKASARLGQAFQSPAGETLYYVFPLASEGFVITSADDNVEPIIAFSASGRFEPDKENPLFALLDRDLPERLSQARGGVKMAAAGASLAETKWASLKRTGPRPQNNGLTTVDDLRVAPFIQSRWNQSTIWNGSAWVACYNYYTPPFAAGTSGNYVCGCNNTAWAQIMRYYCYPTQSIGTAAFDIEIDGVTVNRSLRGGDGLGGPYQWSLMPLVPGVSTTEQQRQAIGALTADIGVASRTAYAAGDSSAYLPKSVLESVFHYANAIGAMGIDSQFPDQVLPNLDSRFPVYLLINGATNHAVVCDGYGYNLGSLYHHLNVGWGGYEDAWYNLPNVAAGGYQFTSVGSFYYNIYTNGGGEIVSGRVLDSANSPIAYSDVQATGGGKTYSTQGDGRGIYALAQLPSDTTFSLSATKNGYHFSPRTMTTGCSQDYTATGNKWGINLVGTQDQTVRVVTGTISSLDGSGIAGVTVGFSNAGGTVTSDSSGFFFNTVPAGWSGAITPAKARYMFGPVFLACTNVVADLGNQDFTGSVIVYVNALASGQNNGFSWTDAFTNLQTALSQAEPGNEIWVGRGIYLPGTGRTNSFACVPGVSLFGGFAGVEASRSQRDWSTHPTVLSGDIGVPGDKSDNVYHVVLGASRAALDGFTVTGGNANGDIFDQVGGGIEADPGLSGFTVANCRITDNCAGNSGGGVYYATVVNSVICSNAADFGGGAAEACLINCLVISNSASQYGGGGNIVTNLNCTIVGNRAQFGGGIYGGIYVASATNCIIYGNNADYAPNYYMASLSYCCTAPLPETGVGNFTEEPRFVSSSGGAFRLQASSPCIDSGNNAYVANFIDLDGRARIVGGTVDMGAYEFQGASSPVADFVGYPTNGVAPLVVNFSDASTGRITNWQWSFGDGGMSSNTNPSHTYASAGVFSVSLTVVGPRGSNSLTRPALVTVTAPVDTLGPSIVVTSPANGATVHNAQLSVSGTATDSGLGNAGVSSVAVNGTIAAGGVANGANTANWTASIPLNTGQNTIVVVATDGNANSTTQALAVTYSPFSVTTAVTPATGGATTGGGSFASGASVTVTAITSSGYHFVNWTESGSQISTSENYSFILNGNRSLTANFAANSASTPVADFSAYPTNGVAPLVVNFDDASTGTITNRLWSFGDGGMSSDVSPSHTYASAGVFSVRLTVVGPAGSNNLTRSNLVTVAAPLQTFSITTTAAPAAGGTTTGSGSFASGASATVTATPSLGYHFVSWSESGSQISTSANYSFILSGNRNLTANFAADAASTYIVIASVLPKGTGKATGGGTFKAGTSRTLRATPNSGYIFVNWTENGTVVSTAANCVFLLNENRNLVANFIPNPFGPVAGTYSGLFFETNGIRQAASGSSSVTVTAKGAYSGSLLVGGKRVSVSGQFDADGSATKLVKMGGNLGSLTVGLQLDLAQGSDVITGIIGDGSTWSAPLVGNRTVFDGKSKVAPQIGAYTIVFPGTNGVSTLPAGDGYGTVAVDKAGRIRFSGSLADGTKLSQVVPVSKHGDWPFYASLYGSQGSILGWLAFGTNDLGGSMVWIKPNVPHGKYYPDGFATGVQAFGLSYTPPLRGNNILTIAEGSLVLSGGNLVQAFTNRFTMGANNRVTGPPGSKLGLTFTPSTGLFRGTVLNPATSKPTSFNGVVLQKTNTGRGFFLDSNLSGKVSLE
jgi:PKD repeat protein